MKQGLLAILISISLANAVPMIYTFTGNMGGTSSDVIDDRSNSGLFWSNNIRYNSSVEYKILVDFDRPANLLYPDGSIGPTPEANNPAYSFFYASYISGDLFTDLFHGSYYRPGDSLASYSRPMRQYMFEIGVNILADSRSMMLVNPNIWGEMGFRPMLNEFAVDWNIGDVFEFYQYVQNPLFIEKGADLNLNLILSDIEPATIPEPSSFVTMLTGILLLPFFLHRCRKFYT